MNCIKNQLACGNIIVDSKNCMATFTVSKISDLLGKIIPFFSKYPLQGSTNFDFMDFCKIANIMLNKSHLTTEGLEEIRQIKFGMNTGRGDNKPSPETFFFWEVWNRLKDKIDYKGKQKQIRYLSLD
jgi:hypothetical protein